MDVSLLGRTEDQKKKRTAAERPFFKFGWACESMISNSLLCAMYWLHNGPLEGRSLTPSQVANGRAHLRVLLLVSVAAAAAAALALRQPVGRRIRLDLALVALAFTAATHFIKMWLLFRFVILTSQERDRILISIFAVGVAVFAAGDLLFFVAIHRGDGADEKE
ncbi:unnamed protein product [Urochloa decumbens]|uniref:Uncharacterized protein n=1 Tax=Urochloa decumbens TaxID=240449 RepID=A0ABC9FTF8_9POAL